MWHVSGSRLKIRYYETPDGAKQFLGWFDSSRGDECTIQKYGPDGTTRCLPVRVAPTFGYSSDSGCSLGLIDVTKGQPAPKYGVFSGVIVTLKPYAGTIYTGFPGSCTSTTAPASDIYARDADVPISSFVEVSVKTEQ